MIDENFVRALICCDNKNPLLNCSDCPYEEYDDCFKRLIKACKEYLSK